MNPPPVPPAAGAPRRQYPDVDSSSDRYARRFAGPVGTWFLAVQWDGVRRLLDGVCPGARVADVGGGHAQLVPGLIAAGFDVTVLGSDPVCAARLAPWLAGGRCRFAVGDLLALPVSDRAFDVVISVRLLPHLDEWDALLAELCRVARTRVIVDYPSRRSVNRWATALFGLKRRLEGDTRPFHTFHPADIAAAFARAGFHVSATVPQFLLPMAFYRLIGRAAVGRRLEAFGRAVHLGDRFGSPVLVRADRLAR